MSNTSDDQPVTREEGDGSVLVVGIGDGVWADITRPFTFTGRIIRAALLPGGTRDGNPTVEILVELADGRLVHANTTWRLWQGMTNVFATHESTWQVD